MKEGLEDETATDEIVTGIAIDQLIQYLKLIDIFSQKKKLPL